MATQSVTGELTAGQYPTTFLGDLPAGATITATVTFDAGARVGVKLKTGTPGVFPADSDVATGPTTRSFTHTLTADEVNVRVQVYATTGTSGYRLTIDVTPPAPAAAAVMQGWPDDFTLPAHEFTPDIAGAPLHPDSPEIVNRFLHFGLIPHWGGIAAFNVGHYSTPVYTVDHTVPGQPVGFRDWQIKNYVPGALYRPDEGGHFLDVPITEDMIPSAGSDGQLTICRRELDGSFTIFDFWRLGLNLTGQVSKSSSTPLKGVTAEAAAAGQFGLTERADFPGWSAVWGGKTNTGTHPHIWFPNGMGSSASGLITAAHSITVRDVRRGFIDHPISLIMYDPARAISWPAQRGDGQNTRTFAPREGQRFRLDPTLNLERFPLKPIGRMVAEAAQIHGFIITDKGGATGVVAENDEHYPDQPITTLLGSTPSYKVMEAFPWEHLQALPVDYGKPA